MLNLKEHSTIGDSVIINYQGPGFYSGKGFNPLRDEVILVKVAEEYMDKEDVYQFCKQHQFKIKPYKINCLSCIPNHWCIDNTIEIEEEENY